MSDAENFVARWARLKRDTAKPKPTGDAPDSNSKPAETASAAEQRPGDAPTAARGAAEPAFDIASLPSIESITANSDIRAFLQSGVPAELTKAALRRAWTTDPAIRDFIGIAENQWDFTDPTAMPGFGPLEATDDVSKLVAQAMGKVDEWKMPGAESALVRDDDATSTTSPAGAASQDQRPQVAGMPNENGRTTNASNDESSVEVQNAAIDVAMQQAEKPAEDETVPNRRGHGRALPR